MKPLAFLLTRTAKNTIRDLFRHPVKLVCYLIFIAVVMLGLLVGLLDPSEPQEAYQDIRILQAVYFALLTGLFILGCFGGVSKGGSLFKMADVNYLFPAPLPGRKILVYGLIRSLGTTLAVSLFVLCYGGMLQQNFGISPAVVVLLMAGYLITLFAGQVASVLFYSLCSGNVRRKKIIKTALAWALLLLLGGIWISANQGGGMTLEHLLEAAVQRPVLYFPFSGWATGAVFAVLAGNGGEAVLFGALALVGIAVLVFCFMAYQPDYYEDVLQNTETSYAVQQAAKEGRIVESGTKKIRVQEKSQGFRRGAGARMFFLKHLKEKKRAGRFYFLDVFTLITLVICVAVAVLIQGEDSSANQRLGIALVAAVYLLFFSNAAGSWSKEMLKPYLYLTPEPAWKKLFWATAASLLKPLVDGVLAFGISGAAAGASFAHICVFILIYFSFGAVFTAVNMAAQRLFGQVGNRGLLLMLYMLFLVILLAPGLVTALIFMMATELPQIIAVLPVLGWNLLLSAGIYLLCRNTLHTMETQ